MSWKDKFPKENRYFETKNGILYCADCMKILPKILDKSIDLTLTDPPYGINVTKMGYVQRPGGDFSKLSEYDTSESWDLKISTQVFNELFRISINQIIFGGNYYTDILPPTRGWIIWDKKLREWNNDYSDGEMIWTSYNRPLRIFRFLWQGGIKQKRIKRVHPTQKPEEIINWVLNKYLQKEKIAIIIDPFLGSGTTAVVAEKLKINWIGIEIDKKYCEIAKKRIELITKQKTLF